MKRSFRSYQGHFVNKEGHIITVKDLKRFICEYCSAFAKDAVVSSCGHVFCKECTDFVLERYGQHQLCDGICTCVKFDSVYIFNITSETEMHVFNILNCLIILIFSDPVLHKDVNIQLQRYTLHIHIIYTNRENLMLLG